MPLINHWWQVTLYVSPRGLSTGAVRYRDAVFDMEFDFVSHVLAIRHSDGSQQAVPRQPAADAFSTGPNLGQAQPELTGASQQVYKHHNGFHAQRAVETH